MKKFRLLVVPPTEKQLNEAKGQLNGMSLDTAREQMTIRYKQMLQTALRTPLDARGGISIEEMEKSLNLLDVLDVVGDDEVLELEDADYAYLLQKLDVVRWVAFDTRIVKFVHTVKNATKDVLELDAAPPKEPAL